MVRHRGPLVARRLCSLCSLFVPSTSTSASTASTQKHLKSAHQNQRDALMPRVPYQMPSLGVSAVADAIRERRAGKELIPLDGVLLNAPRLAAGYDQLLRGVRHENSLPADIRELLILRVAALNSAAYEWTQHEPIGITAGLTTAQLAVIRDDATALTENVDPQTTLSEAQRSALVYADWMTKSVRVPQPIFDAVKAHFDNQQATEITVTVATYNMVSRILVALDVGEKGDAEVPRVQLE